MTPGPPDEESSSRSELLLTLLVDCIVLIVLLAQQRDRTTHASFIYGIGISALIVDMVGVYSCVCRKQLLLGLVALACAIQFFVSALPCLSIEQLIHCLLQPLLVNLALALRGSRLPVWFQAKRSR